MPSPLVSIHLTFALGALLLGPFALWARKGSRGHRAAGYAWVTLMLGAAVSSLFLRSHDMPNIAGYTPIHVVTLATFGGVGGGLWFIVARRDAAMHRRFMQGTYIGGCIVAGLFALAPRRYLGNLLWNEWLGGAAGLASPASILAHTPGWVYGLLAALLALGVSQCFAREASLQRVLTLPLGMTALAVSGLVSAFGSAPASLSLWVMAAVLAAGAVSATPLPEGTRYDAAERRFTLPGSLVPLLLIAGVFSVKYAVGVTLALQPGLAHQPGFAAAVSALYGLFSGLFIGRAARLWKLARATAPRQQPQSAAPC